MTTMDKDKRWTMHWILDAKGEKPVAVDLMTWAKWFEKGSNRIVAKENLGRYLVSTVFLGIDHNFSPQGPPIIWETMVFDTHKKEHKWIEVDCERCGGNREQAEAMHQRMVSKWEIEECL